MTKKRTLLPALFLGLSQCLPGRRPWPGGSEAKVLLRYSPQVGDTYAYRAVLVGYTEITGEMMVLDEEGGWHQVASSGMSIAAYC